MQFNLISDKNGCSSFKIINVRGFRAYICVYLRKIGMNSCLTFVCSCLLCLCNCFSPSASKHVTVLFQRATLARRILHTYVYVSWEPSALWNTGKLNFPAGGSRTSSIFGDEVLGKCFSAARGARITALLCNPSAPKRDWPWTCQTTSEHIPSSSTQATENLNKEAIKKKNNTHSLESHLTHVIQAPECRPVSTLKEICSSDTEQIIKSLRCFV